MNTTRFNEKLINDANIMNKKIEEILDVKSELYRVSFTSGKVMLNECKIKENSAKEEILDYIFAEFSYAEAPYRISLFYKDFDSNTGNLHILPGAIQVWEKKSEANIAISEKDRRRGHGINIYTEYGWEPKIPFPIFIDTNFAEAIKDIINMIICCNFPTKRTDINPELFMIIRPTVPSTA